MAQQCRVCVFVLSSCPSSADELREFGIDAHWFEHPERAVLTAAALMQPHAVIVDAGTPHMRSPVVLRRLKQACRRSVVIALAGAQSVPLPAFDHVLTEPMTTMQLADFVESVLA